MPYTKSTLESQDNRVLGVAAFKGTLRRALVTSQNFVHSLLLENPSLRLVIDLVGPQVGDGIGAHAHGADCAKLHFKTTEKIVDRPGILRDAVRN